MRFVLQACGYRFDLLRNLMDYRFEEDMPCSVGSCYALQQTAMVRRGEGIYYVCVKHVQSGDIPWKGSEVLEKAPRW